jgi:hypothetical protein
MHRRVARSILAAGIALTIGATAVFASSHREAPLISADPQADNTDLYAFRSPDDPNTITIIANYIPMELPEGGPNWYTFGEGVRYEIHIDNDAVKKGDEITYRFTFTTVNEDPTTFFNIRLGKQNQKQTYTCEKSTDGGKTFTIIVQNGVVPPPNIGSRSIERPVVGLANSAGYEDLMNRAVMLASGTGGESFFCGPVDDPFFVDLGGIFDLANMRDSAGSIGDPPLKTRDGVAGFNCHTIALKIPISSLQKEGKGVDQAANILDPNFVIGVWASASRQSITTLRTDKSGGKPTYSGEWVQVSRLGMPLTNEAVIPIGDKDYWNAITPYDDAEVSYFAKYFVNPELALYMDDRTPPVAFGAAVPGLSKLRIQSNSLGSFDFRNGQAGLSGLTEAQRKGTAFETYGGVLLQPGAPRSVDLLPIFYTGAPNAIPYQLANSSKGGNPLAAGKPFINNFLPSLGDMLRLNMAVPITPRNSPDFSSEGLVYAAVLGLIDPRFNQDASLQAIPNMDGFPNGRRLEDDVTRIELQAVSGVVLAAVGLWYDDFSGTNPVTPQLLNVLSFNAGPTHNDMPFRGNWPYLAVPHRGYDYMKKIEFGGTASVDDNGGSLLNMAAPIGFFTGSYPNPAHGATRFDFHLAAVGPVSIEVYDLEGKHVATLLDSRLETGNHSVQWAPAGDVPAGAYMITLRVDGRTVSTTKMNLVR